MLRLGIIALWIAALGHIGGCSAEPPVAAICDLGLTTPDPFETVITSPSLDCYSEGPSHISGMDSIPGPLIPAGSCPSPTCLRVPLERELPIGGTYPPGNTGLSTVECQSDSDCIPESPCVTGFTCGVPPGLTVGQFCCQKFCVCKDYVEAGGPSSPPGLGVGVLPRPIACDPSLEVNECCNLPGRTGNSMYPTCTP